LDANFKEEYIFNIVEESYISLDSGDSTYEYEANNQIEEELNELIRCYKSIYNKEVREKILDLVKSLSIKQS
jgi:predicted DNA-binding protein (UPF0278 family)